MAGQAHGDRYTLFADDRAAERITMNRSNVDVVRVRQRHSPTLAAAAGHSRSVSDMLRFTAAVRRARPDGFFVPSVYTYFPLPVGMPAVVTVHDAIAERYPKLTLPNWRARWFWRAKVRLALWQARLVLTVSHYAARDVENILRVPADRIRVTNEASSSVYRPSESAEAVAAAARTIGLPPDATWYTYVGGLNPHKRVDALVRAHGEVVRHANGAKPHLILVGPTDRDVFHSGADAVVRAIEEAETREYVHCVGFLPDETLRHLHSGALSLVLPSACEGFGLPAIEAAACGTPVVATTESPLPELLAGGGIFVSPDDHRGLVDALRTMATDGRRRADMGRTARKRSQLLSWDKSATVAIDALRQVAA